MAERAWDCRSRDAWPAPCGGEVTYEARHTPGAWFMVSLPAG